MTLAATMLFSSGMALAYTDTSGHWAYKYIDYLSDKGIVEGYPDGTFNPQGLISREEAAQMLSNYAGTGGNNGAALPADAQGRWSTEAVRNLLVQGIIEGYPDGTFKPENKITRAEYATIVYKMLKNQGSLGSSKKSFSDISGHWASAEIQTLAGNGFIQGYPDGTFKPESQITRAESATLLAIIDNGGDIASYSVDEVFRSGVDPMPTIKHRMKEALMAAFADESSPYYNHVPQSRIADIAYWSYPNSLASAKISVESDGISMPFVNPESNTPMTLKIPFSKLLNVMSYEFVYNTLGDQGLIDKLESGSTSKKRVAITFDDGPNGVTTPQILNTLKKYNAKATFFVVGDQVMWEPSIVRRQIAEGHEIGNHSWDHPFLTSIPDWNVYQQILSTETEIYKATGQFSSFMLRPPGLVFNSNTVYLSGMPIIGLNVNTDDWLSLDANAIYNKIVSSNVKDGDIILMHDPLQSTADSLDRTLSYLSKQGFEFVTISELYGYQLYPNKTYSSEFSVTSY